MAQDVTVAQPTRFHSGTAHKTSKWHSPQDFTWHSPQDFAVAQPTRLQMAQSTGLHSGTAHKISQWHSPQEHNGHLKTYSLIMKRKSYKQLDIKHSLDKTKSKYGIHIRIQLRIFEKKLLRNR